MLSSKSCSSLQPVAALNASTFGTCNVTDAMPAVFVFVGIMNSAELSNLQPGPPIGFKSKGNARITATGHTDTSGPESYNMALSLRRANAVKDALVREGVPAQAISVIGRGEQGLLVQTGDGVREPQNRRVEIVVQ